MKVGTARRAREIAAEEPLATGASSGRSSFARGRMTDSRDGVVIEVTMHDSAVAEALQAMTTLPRKTRSRQGKPPQSLPRRDELLASVPGRLSARAKSRTRPY
jgi:hypothetical protein